MKLSLIISERNDPIGTLVTVCSALEELTKVPYLCEIIIVDNSDNKQSINTLRKLISPEYIKSGQIKLLYQDHSCIFTAREFGVENSSGDYLLFVDSHCIFGRDAISNMVSFAESTPNLGFLYGLMNYSKNHEVDSFCDRDIESFIGIRISQYLDRPEPFKIPFRGMPFLCSKELFNSIKGYYTLSRHRLSWGGGDFLLGLKAAILGYDNWSLPSSTVIHLGPFKDDKYFLRSYIHKSSNIYPRRFGMIIAAYIIGGIDLVWKRFNQISSRIGAGSLNSRTIQQSIYFAEEEHRWLMSLAKKSYLDIVNEFKHLQYTFPTEIKTYQLSKLSSPHKPFQGSLLPPIQQYKNDWRSRIRIAQIVNKNNNLIEASR